MNRTAAIDELTVTAIFGSTGAPDNDRARWSKVLKSIASGAILLDSKRSVHPHMLAEEVREKIPCSLVKGYPVEGTTAAREVKLLESTKGE